MTSMGPQVFDVIERCERRRLTRFIRGADVDQGFPIQHCPLLELLRLRVTILTCLAIDDLCASCINLVYSAAF